MNKTQELLNTDPIAEAEKLIGSSWKDDKATAMLGMLMAMDLGKRKRQHLAEIGDTMMADSIDRYESILLDLGFQCVLSLRFTVINRSDCRAEWFHIYANPDGLLLNFDTFYDRINSATVYYCCKAKPEVTDFHDAISSGGYREFGGETYWAGDHDAREALRHKINMLRSKADLMPKWPPGHQVFMWLLHHGDGTCDYKDVNNERIAMLPKWVQEMISWEPPQ